MKKFILSGTVALMSFSVFADEVDYTHCNSLVEMPKEYVGKEGFPARLDQRGSLVIHPDAKGFNREIRDGKAYETISIAGDPANPYSQGPSEIVIVRKPDGSIETITSNMEFKGMKSSTGLGTYTMGMQQGGGMWGPPRNPGMPGGGLAFAGDWSSSMIHDIDVKNGKCFAKRSVFEQTSNNNTHRSLFSEPQLCHELREMQLQEETEGSRLSQLKSCFKDYQDEVKKILDAHVARNEDIYTVQPVQAPEFPGSDEMPQMEPYLPDYLGASNGAGSAFASSIDNIVFNQQMSLNGKNEALRAYCAGQAWSSTMRDLFSDDALFAPVGGVSPAGIPASTSGSGDEV